MSIENAGEYEAIPISHSLLPMTKNGSVGIEIGWLIVRSLDGTIAVEESLHTIRGDVYVFGRRHQRLMGYDQLRDVLGWNGRCADAVEGGSWNPTERHARLTIDWDDYNGKRSLKVDRIGHVDGRDVERSGVGMKEAAEYDKLMDAGPLSEEATEEQRQAELSPVETEYVEPLPEGEVPF